MEELNILSEIKSLDIMILKKMQFDDKVEGRRIPTPTQMQIMEYILKNEDKEIYQKDLENIFHLSRSTVSSVLQTMEKYSLIDRFIDDKDTRTKRIILNKKAKEIFANRKKKFEEIEKKLVKDIKKEELKIFCNVLKKMNKNISEKN